MSPAGLAYDFFLMLEDTAAEWAVTLNCDPSFRARGFVAVPARASLSVHGARCPRCGDTAAPVDVDGVASRGAQQIDTTIRARGTYPTGNIDPTTLVLRDAWDGPRAWPGLGLALDDDGRFRPAGPGDEVHGVAAAPVPRGAGRVMVTEVTEPGQPERRCARDHRCRPGGGTGDGMCLDADGYPDDDL